MALGTKWRLSFKSDDNVDCRVDILKEGYSGTITQLLGADNPVEWQEDDDSDLLKFVRLKTGYIRVVEETFGQLNALYPANDTEHYVRIYRGSNLLFAGYMQATAINQPFVSAPRVLEFAIQSPLAVAKDVKFNTHNLSETLTAADIIKEACSKLSQDYATVIFPRSETVTSPSLQPWDTKFNAVNICPYKDKECYFPERGETPTEPISVSDFLEGVCATFGWRLHDTPTSLVFVRPDFTGSYDALTLSDKSVDWSGRNGSENYDFTTDASNDEGEYEHLRPLRKTTITPVGRMQSVNLQTRNLTIGGSSWGVGNYSYMYFTLPREVAQSGAAGVCRFYKYREKDNPEAPVQSAWMLSNGYLVWNPAQVPPSEYLLFKIDAAKGKQFEPESSATFNVVIEMFLDGTPITTMTAQFNNGKLVPSQYDLIGGTDMFADSNGILYWFVDRRVQRDYHGRISFRISKGGGFSSDDWLFIRSLEIKDPGYQDFVSYPDDGIVQENAQGLGEEKVDVSFPAAIGNECESYGIGWKQQTLYGVTTAHDVVRVSTREARNSLSFINYVVKYNFWKDSVQWKVISMSYNLRLNETRTTLLSV